MLVTTLFCSASASRLTRPTHLWAVSEMYGAVLVSQDSDFKRLAPRVAVGERRRFKTLSRIGLRCKAPRGAQRLSVCLSLVELEWSIEQSSHDKRMIVDIGEGHIRSIR